MELVGRHYKISVFPANGLDLALLSLFAGKRRRRKWLLGCWEEGTFSSAGSATVPLIPSRRNKMGKEVEGGRQVEGGGNWEISVTSPTRLEVDPQLAQAARLTPRPESKDLLFNIFHTTSADLRILKGTVS
jgi:hypothetical protein